MRLTVRDVYERSVNDDGAIKQNRSIYIWPAPSLAMTPAAVLEERSARAFGGAALLHTSAQPLL